MYRKKSSSKRKSSNYYKIGCIITMIVLIPVFYGLYLYISQQPELTENRSTPAPIATPAPVVTPAPATTTTSRSTPTSGSTAKPGPANVQPMPSAQELAMPRTSKSGKEQIIHHAGYTVSYNETHRLPNWVAYELTRQETKGSAKRTNRFIADPQVKGVIATNADYTRSGYDKGHMAPAADMKWSDTAMKESFYFSNMCPQHPELNRRKWKDLEEKIRDWAIADSAIIIVCGPIVEKASAKIGKNKVTVPQKFFKVILSPYCASPKAIGFLFNNERSVAPLDTYAVSVDSIEKLTGMDFFSPLPDELENKIEAKADCHQWGF